jgi:hypothetical protein
MDGIIDIEIYIIEEKKTCRKYTYHLQSEYAARKFHQFYSKGRKFHSKALAILNKFKIKENNNKYI